MPLTISRSFYLLTLLLPLACKEGGLAGQGSEAQSKLSEGRTLLANGQPGRALAALKAASSLAPDSVEPLLLMAEVHRLEARHGAAILALKQAEALVPGDDALIQKQLADLYQRDGHAAQAISTLVALRDAGQLLDPDLLMLARMQALEGDTTAAYVTLERLQRQRPDDMDAKLVEAEVLLLSGEEVLAARLMDRLIEQDPGLTAARLLRARYFLNAGYPEEAQKDLAAVPSQDALRPDVVSLQARVLSTLGRHGEAEAALAQAVEADPSDADALGLLAEIKLDLGRHGEAQQLVEKALKLRPRFARALYVRARALEAQGQGKEAEENYRYALTSDPRFAPALSRLWRLYQEAGRKEEATESLERLLALGEASLEEKVVLAELYVDGRRQLERARKLVEEAQRHQPRSVRYRDLLEAIKRVTPKPPPPKETGPVIIRGGR